MFTMKMTDNAKYAMVSLIIAWLVYDVAIMSSCCIKWGAGVAMEAIWDTPRFRSALGWYVLAQVVVVVNGAVLMRLISAKASRGVRRVVLVLLHLVLAFVSAGLSVVCDGAVWKMNGP